MSTTATTVPLKKRLRCAIYTRKSTEEGLDREFNSLDAQREAAEAFISSQRHEGWVASVEGYDDGGFSGGTMGRPALRRLMRDVEAGNIDCVVVYKVDRLSRSLLDFSRIIETFDRCNVSFVSVTQQFSTTSSMGRLTLNILLSFAQFEREIIGERIRDKIAAAKRKGKHTGGPPVLGYDIDRTNRRIVVNPEEAELVRHIFKRFVRLASPLEVARELNVEGLTTKTWIRADGRLRTGRPWNKADISRVLKNRKYIGEVTHKEKVYPGEHDAIVSKGLWDAAQEILKENYHQRSARTRARTPALLKGIIRCGHCGNSMGITFTRKSGKLYRYYVCVHASKSGYDSCPVKSVAAGEIEKTVVNQLRALLCAPEVIARTSRAAGILEAAQVERLQGEKEGDEERLRLLREMRAPLLGGGEVPRGKAAVDLARFEGEIAQIEERITAVTHALQNIKSDRLSERDVAESLRNLDSVWRELFPGEQARIARLLVDEVVVNADGLEVKMRAGGLWSLVCELQDVKTPDGVRLAGQGDGISVHVPMLLKKRAGRKEIIVPDGLDAKAPAEAPPQDALVKAVARAHRWQEILDAGEVGSIRELAKRLRVDRSYVARILRLTLLAPDIIETILAGKEPSGLSLARLTKTLPILWDEQRKVFGFPQKVLS